MSSTKISPTRRNRVMERDGHRCRECGTDEKLTIDHIVPRSKGGRNDEDNLQVLCRSCNASKGNRSESWMERFKFAKIPTSVMLDTSLSPHARLLYTYMLARGGTRGWFFPSGGQKEMARDLGFSERKVRDCIKELAELVETGRTNHYGAVMYMIKTPAQDACDSGTAAEHAGSAARFAGDTQEQRHGLPTQYHRKNIPLERTPTTFQETQKRYPIVDLPF